MPDKEWEKNCTEETIRLREKALSCLEEKKIDEALNLLERAAELGDAEAQSEYADYFRAIDDMISALEWEIKAAEQGHPRAQNNVAYHYQNGLGTQVVPDLQFYWYQKAAENGFTEAKHSLAVCYLFGTGTIQDFGKMFYWLEQASNDGHAAAKRRLGAFYVQGELGVAVDEEKGWALIEDAAALGDKQAKDLMRFKKKGGCYVATCVYGSYDCPEVLALRRFRDNYLLNSWSGRRFIQIYYAVSPKVVELFGNKKWFNKSCKFILDNFVCKLQNKEACRWFSIFLL